MSEEYEDTPSAKTDAQWTTEIASREKAVQQATNVWVYGDLYEDAEPYVLYSANISGALEQALVDPPYGAGAAVRVIYLLHFSSLICIHFS